MTDYNIVSTTVPILGLPLLWESRMLIRLDTIINIILKFGS